MEHEARKEPRSKIEKKIIHGEKLAKAKPGLEETMGIYVQFELG